MQKIIKIRLKISKTDQKPPNYYKTQINYLKPSIPNKKNKAKTKTIS